VCMYGRVYYMTFEVRHDSHEVRIRSADWCLHENDRTNRSLLCLLGVLSGLRFKSVIDQRLGHGPSGVL